MTPPAAVAAPATRPRRTAAPARPLAPRPRPRRVSGPARPARPGQRPLPARHEGIAAALLRRLARGRTLDRLLRGRAAIGLVAFALIGIVTLQLGLLKLNAGIGRTLQREATLQRANAQLSIENSELAAGERVLARAAADGMKLAPPRSLRFLHSGGAGDAGRGAAALKPPSPTAGAPWSEGSAAAETGSGGEAGPSTQAAAAGESHTSATSEEATHEHEASSASAPATSTTAAPATTGGGEARNGPSGEASSGSEAATSSAAQSGGASAAPGG